MRALLTALAFALPLPALAQVPHSCRLVQQCLGGECRDNPGITLMFEATPSGIISWDSSVPRSRIELTLLPGTGMPAWAGRAPDRGGTVLVTLPAPGRMLIAIHSETETLTATGDCTTAAPPPLSK